MIAYAAENTAQRERLHAVAARLTDADFLRPVEHGWTVAAVLIHLAFWDRNRLAALERWVNQGEVLQPASAPDAINEAVRVIGEAVPPRETARLAVEAADALDRALEQLSPEWVATIEAAGMSRLLNRSLHRREHLDQIEQVLR